MEYNIPVAANGETIGSSLERESSRERGRGYNLITRWNYTEIQPAPSSRRNRLQILLPVDHLCFTWCLFPVIFPTHSLSLSLSLSPLSRFGKRLRCVNLPRLGRQTGRGRVNTGGELACVNPRNFRRAIPAKTNTRRHCSRSPAGKKAAGICMKISAAVSISREIVQGRTDQRGPTDDVDGWNRLTAGSTTVFALLSTFVSSFTPSGCFIWIRRASVLEHYCVPSFLAATSYSLEKQRGCICDWNQLWMNILEYFIVNSCHFVSFQRKLYIIMD